MSNLNTLRLPEELQEAAKLVIQSQFQLQHVLILKFYLFLFFILTRVSLIHRRSFTSAHRTQSKPHKLPVESEAAG